MKDTKTNAMRILDSSKIEYEILSYNNKDGKIDGKSVSIKIGEDPKCVYKTLVTISNSKEIYVFLIPVLCELDLKKAAKVCNEKKLEMIHVKDINKYTGYIRGGCSPIGMKKLYKTFIDESATKLEKIVISAGKIGYQIKIAPMDIQKIIDIEFKDIIK